MGTKANSNVEVSGPYLRCLAPYGHTISSHQEYFVSLRDVPNQAMKISQHKTHLCVVIGNRPIFFKTMDNAIMACVRELQST